MKRANFRLHNRKDDDTQQVILQPVTGQSNTLLSQTNSLPHYSQKYASLPQPLSKETRVVLTKSIEGESREPPRPPRQEKVSRRSSALSRNRSQSLSMYVDWPAEGSPDTHEEKKKVSLSSPGEYPFLPNGIEFFSTFPLFLSQHFHFTFY
jgi:hypothetical protein